jgi:hypothetical protein
MWHFSVENIMLWKMNVIYVLDPECCVDYSKYTSFHTRDLINY